MPRLSLFMAAAVVALLVSFSPLVTFAQDAQQGSGNTTAVKIKRQDSAGLRLQAGLKKPPTQPDVSEAKLSPAAPPGGEHMTGSSAGEDAKQPSPPATPTTSRQEQKPLTRRLEIPRKGITIQYPEDWSVGPKRFANMDELINLPPEQVGKKSITAKIKITTEERRSHEEALRRLEEVRSGIGAPTSAFLTIGGWPAIQFGRLEERPSPGQDEFPRPQFKDKKMYLITTAVAVGDLLVRLEASLPSDANQGLIHQAEAISRSAFFSAKADPKKTQDEVGRLRKSARPRPAPPAAAPADQAAAFTPIPADLRLTNS